MNINYTALTDVLVAAIRALDSDCLQSDSGSNLDDVWEEFKDQIQGQQSVAFDSYATTIDGLCRKTVRGLPREDVLSLWLETEDDLPTNDDIPLYSEQLLQVVEGELYRRMLRRAADEDCVMHSDEYYE